MSELPHRAPAGSPGRSPGGGTPRLSLPAVVFTDLDGTLLDHHTYEPGPALEALQSLEELGVPVVMTTSKTFEETLEYQDLLQAPTPFIAENGGMACIPQSGGGDKSDRECLAGYRLHVAPPGIDAIVSNLQEVRDRFNLRFTSFHDVDAAWVSRQTGLDLRHAELSRRRRSSLPLLWQDSDSALKRFHTSLSDRGLRLLMGGRFHHVLGDWDKSDGVAKILDIYQRRYQCQPQVIAFGDGRNDISMLSKADIAVVVRNADNKHLPLEHHSNSLFTRGIGPEGWAEAVNILLQSEQTRLTPHV